nr:hypothetical protein [Liquorilactobacillus satsumensis]
MKKILTFGLGGLVLIGLLFFAATQVGRTQSTTNEKQKTLTFAATGTSFPTATRKTASWLVLMLNWQMQLLRG